MFSGVKQGCPLAMILFALALDPIIRLMISRLGPNDIARAFCDDLAIAADNVLFALKRLAPIFTLIARSCNLHLAPTKMQACLIGPDAQAIIAPELEGALSMFSGMQFADFVLYLGVYLGPGAESRQWNDTISKMRRANAKVHAVGLGLAASIPMYNSLVHSVGAWLAAIAMPTDVLIAAEARNIQKITRCPWQVIPADTLFHFKRETGAKVEIRSLKLASFAGRTRTALHTATNCYSACCDIEHFLEDDEAYLTPWHMDWIRSSIILGLRDAVNHTYSIAPAIIDKYPDRFYGFQKILYDELLDNHSIEDLAALLTRRWSRWIPATFIVPANVQAIVSNFKSLNQTFKLAIGCALLKVWLNGLCTTARFQHKDHCCPVCRTSAPDHINHILVCPVIQQSADQYWRRPFAVSRASLSLLTTGRIPIEFDHFAAVAIHIYVVCKIYYAARAGISIHTTTYNAFIRKLARECMHTRRLVNFYCRTQRSICDIDTVVFAEGEAI